MKKNIRLVAEEALVLGLDVVDVLQVLPQSVVTAHCGFAQVTFRNPAGETFVTCN